MKKRSKIIALALTFVMAIGFTVGTFAYNRQLAAKAFETVAYQSSEGCAECELDPPGENFQCQPATEGIKCTCDAQLEEATLNDGACTPLYRVPIQ